jgi:hypothetical protein
LNLVTSPVLARGTVVKQLAVLIDDPHAGVAKLDGDNVAGVAQADLDTLAGDLDASATPGHSSDRRSRDDFHDCVIALLHDAQLHEHGPATF